MPPTPSAEPVIGTLASWPTEAERAALRRFREAAEAVAHEVGHHGHCAYRWRGPCTCAKALASDVAGSLFEASPHHERPVPQVRPSRRHPA